MSVDKAAPMETAEDVKQGKGPQPSDRPKPINYPHHSIVGYGLALWLLPTKEQEPVWNRIIGDLSESQGLTPFPSHVTLTCCVGQDFETGKNLPHLEVPRTLLPKFRFPHTPGSTSQQDRKQSTLQDPPSAPDTPALSPRLVGELVERTAAVGWTMSWCIAAWERVARALGQWVAAGAHGPFTAPMLSTQAPFQAGYYDEDAVKASRTALAAYVQVLTSAAQASAGKLAKNNGGPTSSQPAVRLCQLRGLTVGGAAVPFLPHPMRLPVLCGLQNCSWPYYDGDMLRALAIDLSADYWSLAVAFQMGRVLCRLPKYTYKPHMSVLYWYSDRPVVDEFAVEAEAAVLSTQTSSKSSTQQTASHQQNGDGSGKCGANDLQQRAQRQLDGSGTAGEGTGCHRGHQQSLVSGSGECELKGTQQKRDLGCGDPPVQGPTHEGSMIPQFFMLGRLALVDTRGHFSRWSVLYECDLREMSSKALPAPRQGEPDK